MGFSKLATASKSQIEQLLADLDFAEIEMTGGFTSSNINALREAAEAELERRAEIEKGGV